MDFFPVYIVGFAAFVIAVLAAWLFAISCMDLMQAVTKKRGRSDDRPDRPA
jgi:hypothetical protein